MFATRSYTPELLDAPDIPFADIRQNMRELDTINTLLGGHKITLKGLRLLLAGRPFEDGVHIVEIGCGDGNNLRIIEQWAAKKGLAVQLTGIDYNEACIDYALQIPTNSNMQFICSDYRAVQFKTKPHIVFSSLFCHHFKDEDLVAQLQWMQQQSSLGFFINDLHRHPVAYNSIKLLTKAFSKSYLVKNDAPLSVLRGFRKAEWDCLLQKAGIKAAVRWMWAFRWLIVGKAGSLGLHCSL
jgi:2-polyprenyl-3-methyl-5-hydroxy-6-metoxy-1,4-benzoquinol methylase